MRDGAVAREARYSAFISYSHADEAFARRLHRRLESYRLPQRPVHRRPDGSSPPQRLKPIFRDRDDFPAVPDLNEAVREALGQSEHLIVVCSPTAAASEWVNLEIRLFRELHGGGGILAAIARGEPHDAMPPALTEGSGLPHHEPLAADFRPNTDGEHLAFLKLVAALNHIGLDRLIQRDGQRRVRRMSLIGAGSLTGAAVAGVLALAAIQGRIAAEHERARSQGVVNYMLTDLRGQLKSVGRLDALDAVNKGAMGYYKGEDVAKLPVSSQIEYAKAQQARGEDAEKKGDYAGARKAFDDASRVTDGLYRARPNDPEVIYAQAQSAYWNGFIRWRTGDDAGAYASFKAYADLAKRLPNIPGHDPDYQLEPANAESNLGMFVLRQSIDVKQARAQFEDAQRIFETAGRERPNDHDIQLSIEDGYAWLADTDRLGGDYTAALAERMKQRAVLERLLRRDPHDAHAKSKLVSNRLAQARLAAASGNFSRAIDILKQAHAEAVALMNNDPDDRDYAIQARAIDLFEALVWTEMVPIKRPARATILTVIGDCSFEGIVPKDEELTTFCGIVARRALGKPPILTGRTATARNPEAPILSKRWLINFSRPFY